MTERTLEISAALREAHLQHLESSLAAKASSKAESSNEKAARPGERRVASLFMCYKRFAIFGFVFIVLRLLSDEHLTSQVFRVEKEMFI